MAKLKLQPEPIFKSKVGIPVPGGKDELVEFTFKYRDRDELKKFFEAAVDRQDAETLLDMCTGWDLTDPFNRESMDLLVKNYATAPGIIMQAYLEEHTKARSKN